jgi:predicted amidohydrolase
MSVQFKRRVSRLVGVVLVAGSVVATGQASSHAQTFTGKVTIAAVQTDPQFRQKEANLVDMEARARDAAAKGADLIVFPELALTGYKYKTIAEMEPDAEPVPGPSTTRMAAVAKSIKSYIAFGMVEQDGDKFYDAVVLVGPEGYVGKYAKITMGHHSEAVLFTRGPSAPPVFDTSIGRIGLASCYDGAFPENARLMGLQGAQIMVLADTENGTTWRDYVRTRAVENNAFAVVANRVGTERNSTFNGHSLIADPNYNMLAHASTTDVETIYSTVDLGDTSNKFVSQRRPDMYRALTARLDAQVLGVNADPQSSVAGTRTDVDVAVATTGIDKGTRMNAQVVTASGKILASASTTVGVDQARLKFSVPADAVAGNHRLDVTAAGSSKSIPFTVKDVAKPGALGTMPEDNASLASTIYIGFDTELKASSTVPLTLTGSDGSSRDLTGRVNTTAVDNRVTVPYTGLANNTTYTATLPAGAVRDAVTDAGNDEFSFEFSTLPVAHTATGAVAQFDAVQGDKQANLAAIETRLRAAASDSVDVIAFPELTVTGAEVTSRAQAETLAEPIDGPSVNAVAELADELDLTVAFGLPEQAGSKVYNSQVLVGPEGQVIGSHRSTHLRDEHVGVFDAGHKIAEVYQTEAGPMGLVNGYEAFFPEVIRSLNLRGALTVAVGYNDAGDPWREIARSRGSENKIYVLAANWSNAEGRSLITSTSRAINADAAGADERHAKATLNLTTIANRYYTYVDASTAKARTTHYFLDRRPEIYAPLSKKSASSVSMKISSSKVTVGRGSLVATVKATDEHGDAATGDVRLMAGNTTLGTATLKGGSASFTVASTKLAAGRQTLSASYLGDDDFVAASVRSVITVAKATSRLKVKAPQSMKATAKPKVRVTASASGITPSGRVTFTVGGKSVKGSLRDGVATVRLPKLKAKYAKRSQVTVSVKYAGNAKVAKASATFKVKIR